MISSEVDEVWRTFILFTRDYSTFCYEAFGAYIHGQPPVPLQPLPAWLGATAVVAMAK